MNARSQAMTVFRLSLVIIVGMAVGQPIGAGAEEQIVIPYGAGGYRYQIVESGEGFGFEQPEFDDTAFTPGDGGFGTPGVGCELNSGDAVNTTWELGTDILVRREFELPTGTTDLVVNVAIDNDVQVFVNGHDVSGGLQITDGCANWDSMMFAVPDGLLNVGTNLLAVRGRDRGVLAFLDIQVTAELSTIGRLNSAKASFAQAF
jgi:hypothetical protein